MVKYKDTELYLQLYIPINNKVNIYVNDITEYKAKVRKQCLLYKILTETITV